MGVFEDKHYESMDWIAKAVEPIESNLNKILATLPDEIVIDTYRKWKESASGSGSFYTSRLIHKLLKDHDLSAPHEEMITHKFMIELSDPEPVIDMENETFTGVVKIIKQSEFSEDELQKIMGYAGIMEVRHMMSPEDDAGLSRANDVAEVLGKCESVLRTRSAYKKIRLLAERLDAIMGAKEWNIRNMELADKVGKWIAQYIEHGNLAAYTNLCMLKVMTHAGDPIYSIKEER